MPTYYVYSFFLQLKIKEYNVESEKEKTQEHNIDTM